MLNIISFWWNANQNHSELPFHFQKETFVRIRKLCILWCMRTCRFSHVWLLATLWIVVRQAPLWRFSRQELEWVACPLPGIFPTQGSNPCLLSPALAVGFLTTSATWEARWWQCKKVHLLRKTVVMILQKVKHRLTYDPAISAQAYTRKNWIRLSNKPFETGCFKQPKCPSKNEWINKLCYIHVY